VLVSKAGGADLTVTWDAAACPAPGNHLVWLDLDALSSYTVVAEDCAVGSSGVWTGAPPAGSVGVLVVSDDGDSVEGSHGLDSGGQERPSTSTQCGLSQKSTDGTCVP
jgi:hypothetical protein